MYHRTERTRDLGFGIMTMDVEVTRNMYTLPSEAPKGDDDTWIGVVLEAMPKSQFFWDEDVNRYRLRIVEAKHTVDARHVVEFHVNVVYKDGRNLVDIEQRIVDGRTEDLDIRRVVEMTTASFMHVTRNPAILMQRPYHFHDAVVGYDFEKTVRQWASEYSVFIDPTDAVVLTLDNNKERNE